MFSTEGEATEVEGFATARLGRRDDEPCGVGEKVATGEGGDAGDDVEMLSDAVVVERGEETGEVSTTRIRVVHDISALHFNPLHDSKT